VCWRVPWSKFRLLYRTRERISQLAAIASTTGPALHRLHETSFACAYLTSLSPGVSAVSHASSADCSVSPSCAWHGKKSCPSQRVRGNSTSLTTLLKHRDRKQKFVTEQSVACASVLPGMPVRGRFLPPAAEPGETLPGQLLGLRLDLATSSYRGRGSVHRRSLTSHVVRGCWLEGAVGFAGRPACTLMPL